MTSNIFYVKLKTVYLDYDPEHEAALDILHKELRARGAEMFYQQPQTTLTHAQASDW